MKLSRWAILAAFTPAVMAGCGSFGKAMTAHTDVVARAAGKELKVEEAARLLASNPQIPAQPDMVQALADLWVDYTLLATAAAEDTTLAVLDLERFMQPDREQAIMLKLRDHVVRPDTTFTEQEIQTAWAEEGPGAEIRARHILLRIPAEATPAQRDSVMKLAESLRAQAVGGADFAQLATTHSEDPGSAQQGGDLGFFGRGRMVGPFEEEAFKLQPGQVSPVVETPFGLHVIRVEERRQTELGEQREEFRSYLVRKALRDAELAYVEGLTREADIQVQPGAAKVTRELAQQKDLNLRGRAAERPVVRYRGGEITTGEIAGELRSLPPQVLTNIAQGTDEQLEEEFLQQVARKELILRDAERRKVTLTSAEADSILTQNRQNVRQLLHMAGYMQPALPRGTGANAALEARVKELVEGAVSGTRQVAPLGRIGAALRNAYGYEVNEGTFPRVAKLVETMRGTQTGAAVPGQGEQGELPQQPVQPVAPAPQGAARE